MTKKHRRKLFRNGHVDVEVTPINFKLPGFTGPDNVVGADASIQGEDTLWGAFAAVSGDGTVNAGYFAAPKKLGAITTNTAELQATRAALAPYPDGTTVHLTCDHNGVQKLIRLAQGRTVRPEYRQRFQALGLVSDVIDHVRRLDVHVTDDSSTTRRFWSKTGTVGQDPLTVAAHKIAYVLLLLRLEDVAVGDEELRWLEDFTLSETANGFKIKRAYETWRGRPLDLTSKWKKARELGRWEDEGGAIL